MRTPSRSKRALRIAGIILLVPGILLLLIALDAYLVTGFNLGWPAVSSYAIYGGIPGAELVVLSVILLRSKQKFRDALIAIWCLNAVNITLGFKGVFGFY